MRRVPSLLYRDVEDFEGDDTGRYGYLDRITLLVTQECLGDGGTDSEFALAEVGLMLGNDGVGHLLVVVLVQQGYLAQNLHFGFVDFGLVNHAGIGQRVLQFGDAHLQQALGLAGSVILIINAV